MSRVLIIILAVLVLFWLLRRALGSRRRDATPEDGAGGRAEGGRVAGPDLVPCAHCGVLLPKEDALAGPQDAQDASPAAAERFFCSEEHRRLGPS